MSERQKLAPVDVMLPKWFFVRWFVGWLVFSICSFSPSTVSVFRNWKQYGCGRNVLVCWRGIMDLTVSKQFLS